MLLELARDVKRRSMVVVCRSTSEMLGHCQDANSSTAGGARICAAKSSAKCAPVSVNEELALALNRIKAVLARYHGKDCEELKK